MTIHINGINASGKTLMSLLTPYVPPAMTSTVSSLLKSPAVTTIGSTWRRGIFADNGEFMFPGTSYIAVGTTGASWTYFSMTSSNIAYAGGGTIVAVPYNTGTVNSRISYDYGRTWAVMGALPALQAGYGQPWGQVSSDGAGMCIAVANEPVNCARTTDNGATWTAFNCGVSFPDIVEYMNGRWIIRNNLTSSIATSVDGYNWTVLTIPSNNDGQSYFVWTGSEYIYLYGAFAYRSTDLISWTTSALPQGVGESRSAYGNGQFLYIYSNTGANLAYSTSDFSSWTAITPKVTIQLCNNMIHGGSKFVLVGSAALNVPNCAVIA